ncbi:MAG: superoxide dismutase [Anaerolineales bacterium]
MAFQLPPLPYPMDALEPHIDARTMEIHHGKHHAAYVTNLNAALESHADLQKKSVEELLAGLSGLPEGIRNAVRNHGGGHANHSLFWTWMAAGAGGEPGGALAKGIAQAFSDFVGFKDAFTKAAMGRFGSGWAWLAVGPKGLEVISTANQDHPILEGKKAVLGVDVWEHAYYLKYQNRRADYVAAWWNVVNWKQVGQTYEAAMG